MTPAKAPAQKRTEAPTLSLEAQIVDTWQISQRVNLYVLDAITPEALADISASKGRSVAKQLAHLHNTRIMWLEAAAPDLLEGIAKIPSEDAEAAGKDGLRAALEASGQAIATLLERSIAAGRVKGFKPHPAAFLGYLLAHEAYHRGEIGIILAQCGHPLDKKTSYGMWEWGAR